MRVFDMARPKVEALQETTEWNCGYNVQNHIYLVKNRFHLIAYKRQSDGKVIKMKKPMQFYTKGRSFKSLKNVDELFGEFL